MKRDNKFLKAGPSIYTDRLFRLVAALLSAHIIVAYGEKETFFELLALPAYYPALGISFIIAVFVIDTVYYFTRYLDRRLPWCGKWKTRLAVQFIACVLFPLFLDCLIADLYYRFNDTNIFAAGHFRYNFLVIVLMVLLLNAWYFIYYLINIKSAERPAAVRPEAPQEPRPAAAEVGYIVLIYSKDKICYAYDKQGNKKFMDGALEKIMKQLPADKYFLINRGCLVERTIIKGFSPGKSRTLNVELDLPPYSKSHVSQRKVSVFKKWYARKEM